MISWTPKGFSLSAVRQNMLLQKNGFKITGTKKAKQRFQEHEQSLAHKEAVLKVNKFWNSMITFNKHHCHYNIHLHL